MTSVLQTVDELKVVVCTGPGGVGKTTSAAALALALATQGRRVALITVDPARRLADALGLEALTNHPTSVALPRTVPGSVDAMMLDTRETFDDLVRRHAQSAAQGDRILANRFYQNIAGALGGKLMGAGGGGFFMFYTRPEARRRVLETIGRKSVV